MKRILSLVLCFLIAVSSAVVFAEDVPSDMPNLAIGKTITATNQYASAYRPALAIDGNVNTAYSSGSEEIGVLVNGHKALVLDLGATYNLNRIIARSRRDVDQGPMRSGWTLEVANTPSFKDSKVVGTKPIAGDFKSDLTVNFAEPVIARYIMLWSSNSSFVVSELEAYGEKYAGKSYPTFTDVKDADYSAVELMYNLGIMEGISLSEFGVNKLMRRADAAKVVAKAANLAPSKSEKTTFYDVTQDNQNLGYITTCLNAGIISKADYFRPDDFLKGSELLKMITSAMGYDKIANAIGSYPQNVIQLSNDLNILKGVNVDPDSYVSYLDIAKIVYNALITPVSAIEEAIDESNGFNVLYTEGKPFLEKAFGLNLYKGVITANDITGLISGNGEGDNALVINNVKYYDETEMLFEYIGQNIFYLCDDEKNIKGGWVNKPKNNVYTVRTKDIDYDKTTGSEIKVLDVEGETESYDLAEPLYVLKNGVAFDDFSPSDLKNYANGKLNLIDNDADGTIDVMHILNPVVIVTDYIKRTGDAISAGGLNSEKIDVENCKHFKCTVSGRLLDVTEITKGTLINAYVSENGKYVSLEVVRNSVSGTVTKVSDNELTINDENYSYSNYYLKNKAKLEKIVPGQQATYVFDEYNELVWFYNVSLGKVKDVLGFIQRYDIPKGLANIQIKVYNESAQFLTLDLADKILIDGTSYSQDNLKKLLENDPSYLTAKFALYNVNALGQISGLDTENYDIINEADSKMINMGISLSGSERRVTDGIYSNHKMVLPILSNFPMFSIPVDEDFIPLLGEEYEEFYAVSTINKRLPNGDVKIGGETRFLGADEYGSPTLGANLMCVDSSISSVGVISSLSADGFIVDYVLNQASSDGEKSYALVGFDMASKTKKTMVIDEKITNVIDTYKIHSDLDDSSIPSSEKPSSSWFTLYRLINDDADLSGIEKYFSSISELQRGDVVRFEVSGGVATALERVYKNETADDTTYGIRYTAGDHYMNISSSYRVASTGFKNFKNNILVINTSLAATEIINCANISGGFYVVEKGRVLKYDIADIPVYCTEDMKLVVISKGGRYHSIIAYND